jgi:hypothetical protein
VRCRGLRRASAILAAFAAMFVAGCGAVSSAPRWYTARSRLPSCGALNWDVAPIGSPLGRSAVRCLVTAHAAGRQAELDVQGQPDTDGTLDVTLRVIDRRHVVMMLRFYHFQSGNRWTLTECATFDSPSSGSTYANLGSGCGPEQTA